MSESADAVLRQIRALGADILNWTADVTLRLPVLKGQLVVGTRRGLSEVSVDYRFPAPGPSRVARFRITTHGAYHLAKEYGVGGSELNVVRRESRGRGRSIYCIDLDSQRVISAVGYHIDDNASLPILIRGVATLQEGDDEAIRVSRGTAVIILGLLHLLSDRLSRPPHLDFNAPNKASADEVACFGFRRATPPANFSYSIGHAYLRLLPWWPQ